VALTVAVATGAGLLLQSFVRLIRVDPGFNPGGVLAVDLSLPSRYGTAASQRAFFEEAITRLGALPGVTDVSATSIVPQGDNVSGMSVNVEGRQMPPGSELSAGLLTVSDQYFKTLGIPFLAGRGFTPQDARVAVPLLRWFPQQPLPPRYGEPQPAPVAVINETMARRFWPELDPLGRRFTVVFSPPITVIGVVKDSKNRGLADEPWPEFYVPQSQEPGARMTLLVRAPGVLASLPPEVRSTIWSIDRELPATNMRTLWEIVDGNVSLVRAVTSLMGAFAAMALALMALGVYAVVSYTTAQRTYEMGVRLALGAQPRDIRRLVLFNGVWSTAAGIAIGLGGAYVMARFASNLLYGIAPADPPTYAALTGLVFTIVLLATWLPARRAQRVDPVAVLRND